MLYIGTASGASACKLLVDESGAVLNEGELQDYAPQGLYQHLK